jgi:uncharacterized membrane protein YeaQ/YmgE (transglycosylase-associated protein family)
MDITSIIIDIIAGAIGGNATGAVAKQFNLGTAGNSIAGVIGGVIGGWITTKFFGGAAPVDAAAAAAAATTGIGQILEQGIGGLVGGGVIQVIAGIIKQQTAKA